jgi:type III pantothenate kinase
MKLKVLQTRKLSFVIYPKMKQLVIDIGNTRNRAAVFSQEEMLDFLEFDELSLNYLNSLRSKYQIDKTLICSVSGKDLSAFENENDVLVLNPSTKLPFQNSYFSPLTLGADRKALVSAALQFKPNKNCLIIDAGTCVTYDFIEKSGNYLGGSISPGLQMRLKAMNYFTGKLPLPDWNGVGELIGNDTNSCLKSGAFWGLIGEIEYFIQEYEAKFDGIEVLFTGGDSEVLSIHLKRPLFVVPHLIMFGLNKILNFNVKKGV